MIFRESFEVSTQTFNYVDITKDIEKLVEKSKVKEGLCHVFLPGTTAGIVLNEMDPFLMEDFKRVFRQLIDDKKMYSHPDNAPSHLRAALLQQSISLPVSKSKLMRGTWQSILLWEFDVKPRARQIVVTVTGE